MNIHKLVFSISKLTQIYKIIESMGLIEMIWKELL